MRVNAGCHERAVGLDQERANTLNAAAAAGQIPEQPAAGSICPGCTRAWGSTAKPAKLASRPRRNQQRVPWMAMWSVQHVKTRPPPRYELNVFYNNIVDNVNIVFFSNDKNPILIFAKNGIKNQSDLYLQWLRITLQISIHKTTC
jgi:hypothetical protein